MASPTFQEILKMFNERVLFYDKILIIEGTLITNFDLMKEMDTQIQIDGSYLVFGSIEAEIWPSKSEGLVQGKMVKSKGKNAELQADVRNDRAY